MARCQLHLIHEAEWKSKGEVCRSNYLSPFLHSRYNMFSCVLSNIRTIVLAIALGIGLIIAAIAIGLSVGLIQKQTESQATTS